MRPIWPDDTVFDRLVLDVESDSCEHCGRGLHICDHRFHRFHTLQGPMELVCRLAHCSDRACPARCHTLSPAAEMAITLPRCLVAWDVFCWLGHRRFQQHWSVPQLQDELQQSYHINLSRDTLSNYLRRYQNLLAARQQDPVQMAEAYRGITSLVLTIDGLQPEKGHETLYVVRELNAKRIWFGEALLSSSTDEVRGLFVRAREIAAGLGLPVKLWLSDKQDAFVKGIAAEFTDVPHRYCQNHFVRDLAKPTLAKDSSAKVQMRKKVRGLRSIEREVLDQRRERKATEQGQGPLPDEAKAETVLQGQGSPLDEAKAETALQGQGSPPDEAKAKTALQGQGSPPDEAKAETALQGQGSPPDEAKAETALQGQGSPPDEAKAETALQGQGSPPDEAKAETASTPEPAPVSAPPGVAADIGPKQGGLSAAAVAQETAPGSLSGGTTKQTPAGNDALEHVVLDYCAAVRGILNDDQGGPLHPPGMRMAEGLREVQESLERNLELNKPGPAHGQLERLAGLIESGLASVKQKQAEVQQQVEEISKVAATLEESTGTRKERRARYKKLQHEYEAKGGEFYSHLAQLMVSWMVGLFLGPRAKKGEKGMADNLELERWFRKPKGHERRIHGRRHAGMRIVQEGPTLVHVLDAHDAHPGPFKVEDLAPYWSADAPPEQQEAIQRRRVMRKARSKKKKKPPRRVREEV